jgi:F-type H+-transporting ATPase subunit a
VLTLSSLPSLAAAGELSPESHVLPHYLFGTDWLTNHHLMSIVGAGVGIAVFVAIAGKIATGQASGSSAKASDFVSRGTAANLLETLCQFVRNDVAKPMLGKATDRYIYYIWSVFFFILLGNLLGMLPIGAVLGLVNHHWSHIGGTYTGNLNFAAGLAIISLVMIVFIGLRENGFGFIAHMWPVPLKPLYLSPLLLVVGLLIFILEVIGLGIKSFALCIRLFANMVAGHLVLGSLVIMVVTTANVLGKGLTVFGATLISFMELFVAFLQAYIFTFLTVIFISLGLPHGDHSHDEGHGHDHSHDHKEGHSHQGAGHAHAH